MRQQADLKRQQVRNGSSKCRVAAAGAEQQKQITSDSQQRPRRASCCCLSSNPRPHLHERHNRRSAGQIFKLNPGFGVRQ